VGLAGIEDNRRVLRLLNTGDVEDRCIELIKQQIGNCRLEGRRCTLTAITCYIDFTAARTLIESVAKRLEAANAILEDVVLLYDIGEWARQRTDADERVRSSVAERIGLADDRIRFVPTAFPDSLMHSKAYAVTTRAGKTSGQRRGVVVITSANLTHRGMGTRATANVELAQVSRDPSDLREIRVIAERLEARAVSPERQLRQNDFLFAIRLLSSGRFYHQWQGNLSAEARFTLRLTPEGKRSIRLGRDPFRKSGYVTDADSFSKDPLDVAGVFRRQSKPIPRTFIRMFTVDTLLGRWVPARIASMLDDRLRLAIEPYMDSLGRRCADSVLDRTCEALRDEVRDFGRQGLIDATHETVDRWREKVIRLRGNRDLVSRIVFNLERIEEPFADLDRKLILKTFGSLRGSLDVRATRGELKRVLARAIEYRPPDCISIFEELEDRAREGLK
jgi:hypothetical protein